VTTTRVISTYGEHVMPRYVYAWFLDVGSGVYGPYFDDIIYDRVAPTGAVWAVRQGPTVFLVRLSAQDDNSDW